MYGLSRPECEADHFNQRSVKVNSMYLVTAVLPFVILVTRYGAFSIATAEGRGEEVGTNYWGSAGRQIRLYMFLSLSVAPLFVCCTN